MKMKRLESLLPFFVLTGALMIVLWPLFRPGFYLSDDGEWMVIRLSAFYQSLADHQFPVRFLGRLNNSYGYPVANFLYPGFLYIGSLLRYAGFSFVTSIKIILGGSVIGTAVILFLWLRREFSRFSSIMGVLGFVGAPYLLYDLYKRGSVGEILALLPASAGIYSIESNKKWLFPLTVAFLIVSHNTLALLFLAVYMMLILFRRRFDYVVPFMLGVGMAAFFWVPALTEKRFVRFDTVNISDPFSYMLTVKTAWLAGYSGVVAFLFLLFHRGKDQKRTLYGTYAVLFLGSVVLATPLSGALWRVSSIAAFVQFPYRMLAVGILTAPWLVAAASERFVRRKMLFAVVLIPLLAVPAWHQLQKISYIERDEGYYTTNEGTTTVRDEYMPRWVRSIPDARSSEKIVIESGRGSIVYEYLNTQRIIAHIDASEESIVRLNTIYYPGWGIMIDDTPVKITYQNPNGFIQISVPTGRHRFVAEFRETVPRFLADIVSLVSFIAFSIFLFRFRRR